MYHRIGVMIGSPADAAEERAVITDSLLRWNGCNGSKHRVLLDPVRWETHCAPGLEGRPQGMINSALIPQSDCLIAVFRYRAGSPTGVDVSGTIEEIRQFMRLGKYVAVYFYEGGVSWDQIDLEQLNVLKKFRDELEQRGLIARYTSRDELAALVLAHLSPIVDKLMAKRRVYPLVDDDSLPELATKSHRRLFAFVDSCLSNVSYLSIYPPIDVPGIDNVQLTSRVRRKSFRFAPPDNRQEILHDILKGIQSLSPSDPDYAPFLEQHNKRLWEGDFADRDELDLDDADAQTLNVFRSLEKDTDLLHSAKRLVLEDYLLRRNGFEFNGHLLCPTSFHVGRNKEDQHLIDMELRSTDFYTFSVLNAIHSGGSVLGQFTRRTSLTSGPVLGEYLAQGIQRNVHPAVGLEVALHTLRDNRAVITRRSASAASRGGEAGKYFAAVSEGIIEHDISPNNTRQLLPFCEIVRRSLDEELFGSGSLGTKLWSRIAACKITGVFIYFPNMSIILAVYVAVDCTADDVRASYLQAKDGRFETVEIVDEKRWDERIGLPEYSIAGLEHFFHESVVGGRPKDTWDEGALVTYLLGSLSL